MMLIIIKMVLWLSRGDLKAGTEGEILAAQDEALKQYMTQQKYYRQKQILNAD
jgi:hypothetical protein